MNTLCPKADSPARVRLGQAVEEEVRRRGRGNNDLDSGLGRFRRAGAIVRARALTDARRHRVVREAVGRDARGTPVTPATSVIPGAVSVVPTLPGLGVTETHSGQGVGVRTGRHRLAAGPHRLAAGPHRVVAGPHRVVAAGRQVDSVETVGG